MSHARRRVAATLDRAGLLPPIVRARERWIASRARDEGPSVVDGIPMPPARLRVLVDGHGDPQGFLDDGRATAAMLDEMVARAGTTPRELGSILDFGCGCGRVVRHWPGVEGPRLHGCDYNPDLVGWCQENLGFMEARVNQAAPPTPYEDDSFDLLYAISILTHLTEAMAHDWVAEWARILRPGGLLIATTHGATYRERMTGGEREQFDRGEAVVQRPRTEGTNACAAYHPRQYVEGSLLERFDVLSFSGEEPLRAAFPQDVYLARLRR